MLAAAAPRPPEEPVIRADYDLVVVGGGMAGVPAAISAARNGARVALVHERAMLGGNASSEVSLYPEDSLDYHPWAKPSGIHEEFHTEERVRNHLPISRVAANAHWDLVLYEWANREDNLDLYLNTHMHRVITRDDGRIHAVYAIQLGSEESFELSGRLFLDATGIGTLGFRAGAEFRWGREARSEYDEPEAPPEADEEVMGSTLHYRATDIGRPVPFQRPEWAAEFPTEEDLYRRGHSRPEGGYFWIELAGPHHVIHDNDKIVHELLRQSLGVFDHVKNRGDHGAENHALDFLGFWPYRRAGRRMLGDYVITQHHVQDPQPLDDAVAFGCWGIDVHPTEGVLARDQPPMTPKRADQNFDRLGSQVYGIPVRALYSRNVPNLLTAGRTISASHVGFGSSRVLATSSTVGQAVGVVAAQCLRRKAEPAELVKDEAAIAECRQIILRQDGHIPGVVNEDPADSARQAQVRADAASPLEFPEPDGAVEMKHPLALLFPLSGERIDEVWLPLQSRRADAVRLRLGLRPAAHVWDFRSKEDLGEAFARVPPGHDGWISFRFDTTVEPGKLYYVYAEARPGLFWRSAAERVEEPSRCPVGVTAADLPGAEIWRPMIGGKVLCMRVAPESRPYEATNAVRGTNRPDQWTNLWISDPSAGLPAQLELQWPRPRRFNQVELAFDTDFSRRRRLPLFRYPECVKDYDLTAANGGAWKILAEVRDNYVRRRVHRFDPIEAERLQIRVLSTNGTPSARIYEVRVYDEP